MSFILGLLIAIFSFVLGIIPGMLLGVAVLRSMAESRCPEAWQRCVDALKT